MSTPQAPTFRTLMKTYLTVADGKTKLIYSTPKNTFVKASVTLLTAGPVDVGTDQNISPVLSGNGASLITNEPLDFTLSPGNRLYIVSSTVDRVRLIVEPFAYLEQILEVSSLMADLLSGGNIAEEIHVSRAKGDAVTTGAERTRFNQEAARLRALSISPPGNKPR